MRSMRVLAIAAIVGFLLAGVIIDLPDRPGSDRSDQYVSALAAPTGVVNTWFCPGGSGTAGVADVTIEVVNGSDGRRTATVSVLPGGSDSQQTATVEIAIEPRGRVLLQPSGEVPGAEWVGAMVEVDGTDVVVEQILTAAQGAVGRSPCLTRTADSWVVSNGATRSAVERERFIVMLLNPFPDVAVADIELVADVGRDSIEGLVVPAQRVVAVDVTEEVTVAATVAAFIDVVSGRVAASWIQIADGPIAGRGTRTAPGCARCRGVVAPSRRGCRRCSTRRRRRFQPIGRRHRRGRRRDRPRRAGSPGESDRNYGAAGPDRPRRPLPAGSPRRTRPFQRGRSLPGGSAGGGVDIQRHRTICRLRRRGGGDRGGVSGDDRR